MQASSASSTWSAALPDFEVTVETIRSGRRIIRLLAADAISARLMAQSECETGGTHCPPDWCTDDVQSLVVDIRRIGASE
jgi:hypothetical protein